MNIFLLHQIPTETINDRDKFDAIVFGTTAHKSLNAAKDSLVCLLEEDGEPVEITWIHDPQLEVWRTTNEDGDVYAISVAVI